MANLVGISGSLRKASWNTCLLKSAASLLPDGTSMEIVPIQDIPLFNEDLEESDFPPAVTHLKSAISSADGLVICTPEYNGSMPGVLKNTIDWMSRPIADQAKFLYGTRVLLMGATAVPGTTFQSQSSLLPVLRALRMNVWTDSGLFFVPNAAKAFADGQLIEKSAQTRVEQYLGGFVDSLKRK